MLFLRGDSGFAVPALYDLCEAESVYYVIRLKSNAVLQSLAKELRPNTTPSDVSKTEIYYEEIEYQAKSWSKPRKVIVQSLRPAGELFFTHSFFVTNVMDAFSPKAIVRAYQKRGTMENYIKEAKNGFNLDKMCSHSFQVNEVRMMLSLLAYNLTNWLRTLCFPEGQKNMQIQTIRTKIIKVASKLVKSGRSLYFKLSSSFVYQTFFWGHITAHSKAKTRVIGAYDTRLLREQHVSEDPAGSAFLPRRLRPCPWKASVRSGNHLPIRCLQQLFCLQGRSMPKNRQLCSAQALFHLTNASLPFFSLKNEQEI